MSIRYNFLLMSGLLLTTAVQSETLNVAVASNFVYTLKLLSNDFMQRTDHSLLISSASTGKLYAQIQHGAPFDVFLAADEKRPDLLIKENKADDASAYVYAIGRLVLMSNIVSSDNCQSVLTSSSLHHLSIANPKIAPYGVAAKQVLEKLSLWSQLQPKLVRGENVAQALQFISTGNAQAGFVAGSMLVMDNKVDSACIWVIPADVYSPIKQKMVLLKKAKDKPAAQAFIQYMQSERAKEIIKSSGYDVM